MGQFERFVESLNEGGSVTVDRPAGNNKGIKKIYVSSANLTYIDLKTDFKTDHVPKSENLNYQEGFFPVEAVTTKATITAHGMSSAEDVTIIIEWE